MLLLRAAEGVVLGTGCAFSSISCVSFSVTSGCGQSVLSTVNYLIYTARCTCTTMLSTDSSLVSVWASAFCTVNDKPLQYKGMYVQAHEDYFNMEIGNNTLNVATCCIPARCGR